MQEENSFKYQPGEIGVMHRKFGPCSIIDHYMWKCIKLYKVRIHGTSTHIEVTEGSLTKEQKHE